MPANDTPGIQTYNSISATFYLFTFNNRNTRKRFEMHSKLTIKTPE